jgi:hypothetical protein
MRKSFGVSEPCAAGSGILGKFAVASGDGPDPCDQQPGIISESMFDAAVLKRVKTDNTKPAADANAVRNAT